MSLIQEALRRQQEEAGGGKPDTAPPPLPPPARRQEPPIQPDAPPPDAATPAPEPPPPQEAVAAEESAPEAEEQTAETQEHPKRPWLILVGVSAAVLLAVGLGIWLVLFAFSRWKSGKQTAVAPQEQTVTPKAEPAVLPASEVALPAPSPEIVAGDDEERATEKPAESEPTPEQLSNEVTEPHEADPDAQTVVASPSAAVAPPAIAAAPPPAIAVESTPQEPEVEKPPVIWPPILLNGIVGRGLNGSAMINGQIVGVNEKIDEVRLVSIRAQGAVLEYEGETKFLKVGSSME